MAPLQRLAARQLAFQAEGLLHQRLAEVVAAPHFRTEAFIPIPNVARSANPAVAEIMQRELLKIRAQRKKTVLFITHQIDEAIYLADRVLVFSYRPGRLTADIPIPFARPRDLSLKRTPEFLQYVDKVWSQALGAGATVKRPLDNQFYGDRNGALEDPFGHTWNLSSHVEDV